MRNLFMVLLLFLCVNLYGAHNEMSPEKTKRWIQKVLLSEYNLSKSNYAKYISDHFVGHTNGKVFDYSQWVQHLQTMKGQLLSYTIHFDEIAVERDKIAVSYLVQAQTKDGIDLKYRVVGLYKVKHQKLIFSDEVVYLLKGPYSAMELPTITSS